MAGEPILIVDDTPVNLKLTRILLVNEGYTVLTAASAEEALELLRSYHPRLILADIQLPGMDGLEMTRRIKQDERTRDIAVVALTAFAMKGDEQKAMDAGCDGYITKPIDTRTLGGRIRELLDRTRRRRDAACGRRRPSTKPFPPPKCRRCAAASCRKARSVRASCCWTSTARSTPTEAARAVHQWIGTGGLLGYTAHRAPGPRSGNAAPRTAGGYRAGARIAHQSAAGLQHAARGARNSRPGADRRGTLPGSASPWWVCPRMKRSASAWPWSAPRRGPISSNSTSPPGCRPELAQCDLVVVYVRPGGSAIRRGSIRLPRRRPAHHLRRQPRRPAGARPRGAGHGGRIPDG